MLNYQYVTYGVQDDCKFDKNLDVFTDIYYNMFWNNPEHGVFKVSKAVMFKHRRTFNEDVRHVVANLDMLLLEGEPLAIWINSVGFGTKFIDYGNTVYILTENGIALEAELA